MVKQNLMGGKYSLSLEGNVVNIRVMVKQNLMAMRKEGRETAEAILQYIKLNGPATKTSLAKELKRPRSRISDMVDKLKGLFLTEVKGKELYNLREKHGHQGRPEIFYKIVSNALGEELDAYIYFKNRKLFETLIKTSKELRENTLKIYKSTPFLLPSGHSKKDLKNALEKHALDDIALAISYAFSKPFGMITRKFKVEEVPYETPKQTMQRIDKIMKQKSNETKRK